MPFAQMIAGELAERFGISDVEGVIVENIEAGSPAYEAGIREGDIIREIARTPVKDLEMFNKVIRGLTGNVLVRTDNGYVIVKE